MSAKASAPDNGNSPYRQFTNNVLEAFNQVAQNAIHPSEVARVIIQAVMADNPDFRYAVGKDAATLLEARRNMSDREFEEMIKKQLNL